MAIYPNNHRLDWSRAFCQMTFNFFVSPFQNLWRTCPLTHPLDPLTHAPRNLFQLGRHLWKLRFINSTESASSVTPTPPLFFGKWLKFICNCHEIFISLTPPSLPARRSSLPQTPHNPSTRIPSRNNFARINLPNTRRIVLKHFMRLIRPLRPIRCSVGLDPERKFP